MHKLTRMVVLDSDQDDALLELKANTGASVSWHVRQAIALYLSMRRRNAETSVTPYDYNGPSNGDD
jgi:hypothetical protein